MKLPEDFTEGNFESIIETIKSGKWVLVVSGVNSEKVNHLEYILSNKIVRQAMGNFECFYILFNSETAKKLSLNYPVGFYVFVKEITPYRIYNFARPDYIDPEDIIQFLDDTASFILSEEDSVD